MNKPRKAKLEIRSSQDSPRRKPKEEDNLKKEKHVSHLFEYKKYNYLYVHENGPEDRDHMKNGTGTNELDQGVDKTEIEERDENTSANDSISPLDNMDGGNGTVELHQNNSKRLR